MIANEQTKKQGLRAVYRWGGRYAKWKCTNPECGLVFLTKQRRPVCPEQGGGCGCKTCKRLKITSEKATYKVTRQDIAEYDFIKKPA